MIERRERGVDAPEIQTKSKSEKKRADVPAAP